MYNFDYRRNKSNPMIKKFFIGLGVIIAGLIIGYVIYLDRENMIDKCQAGTGRSRAACEYEYDMSTRDMPRPYYHQRW